MLIAAKSYEKDDKIPKSAQLIRYLTNVNIFSESIHGCSSGKIVRCEREVLNTISWDYENQPIFYDIIGRLHLYSLIV